MHEADRGPHSARHTRFRNTISCAELWYGSVVCIRGLHACAPCGRPACAGAGMATFEVQVNPGQRSSVVQTLREVKHVVVEHGMRAVCILTHCDLVDKAVRKDARNVMQSSVVDRIRNYVAVQLNIHPNCVRPPRPSAEFSVHPLPPLCSLRVIMFPSLRQVTAQLLLSMVRVMQ